jgi:hypothetical protein
MTTESMIQLIAIILGSNWLGQFLMEVYKSKSKKKTPIEVIIRALARRDLLKTADDYIDHGYIPSDEYDDFIKEYKAYKDLDGNGKVEKLVTIAMDLPIKNGGTE